MVVVEPCAADPLWAQRRLLASNVDTPDLHVGVLFERLLDAVVVAHLATGRIVLWNPAAEKLFGYTAEEAIGQSIEILMPEAVAEVHRAGLERYLRTGHGLLVDARVPAEMPARTRTGEDIRVELSLTELPNCGGERFALAIIRDASLRKQLEITRLELAQARLGWSEAEAELTDREDALDAILVALANDPRPGDLRRLTDALADLKRLHAGEIVLSPQQGDLVDLFHTAADAARKRAGAQRLSLENPPTAPAVFDAAITKRILEQLTDELIEGSRPGSRIELRLELLLPQSVRLTARAEMRPEAATFRVSLQLSRALMQRQGGALQANLDPVTSVLEVELTLPGWVRSANEKQHRPGKFAGRVLGVRAAH